MPGMHVQSSPLGTTDLFLLNNWLVAAYVFSPPFLSISSASPAQFFSSYCSLSPLYIPSLCLLCCLSFFPLPSITLRLPRLWIVKVASTYRHLCNQGDKEGSILNAFDVRHPWRGEASFSVFTSSGQFLTPQLLFGNACRQWRERETGKTWCRRLKCYIFVLFSV